MLYGQQVQHIWICWSVQGEQNPQQRVWHSWYVAGPTNWCCWSWTDWTVMWFQLRTVEICCMWFLASASFCSPSRFCCLYPPPVWRSSGGAKRVSSARKNISPQHISTYLSFSKSVECGWNRILGFETITHRFKVRQSRKYKSPSEEDIINRYHT